MSRILLVRHGQASFGAADYDRLSELGEQQSRVLGAALRARGTDPTRLVAGEMRRHAQTAVAVSDAAAWERPVTVDPGWNEFDHVQVLAVHAEPARDAAVDEQRAFQQWFEAATLRWTDGQHDDDYDESFLAFTLRVDAALQRLVEELPASGTAVVLTSGGPVAWATAGLLADDHASRTRLWLRLNPVSVNTGITTVVVGRRGPTLVTFNDHSHLLSESAGLVTYR